MDIYHRADIASDLANKVLQSTPGSASSSGLFLAAPRRTGKSTFIREDLRPALEKAGALVLYVDLWADRKAEPGTVIVNAVRAELARHEGVMTRLARSAGMDKVTVAGILSFSLDKVGLGNSVPLSQALAELSDEIKRPIALVIDEAQHAITSQGGLDALFALKAARDELNSSRHHGLRIIATGSNRDKLAMLRAGRDQAFFGAPLVSFPPLGRDFIQWFCKHASLPESLDVDETYALFERTQYRPEMLGAAVDQLRFEFGLNAADVKERFREEVDQQISSANDELLRVVYNLTPVQSTVLRVAAARGAQYAPFEAGTMAIYESVMQAIAGEQASKIDVTQVQSALQALQDRALVWRAARGVYAMEEHALADMMRAQGMLDAVPQIPRREGLQPKNNEPAQ